MTHPVSHWLAGWVLVGLAVTVTVVVLVAGAVGVFHGVATARMARVEKIASLENIVNFDWGV